MNTVNCLQMGFEFGAGFSLAVLLCGSIAFAGWLLCDVFFGVIRYMRIKYMARRERKKTKVGGQIVWKK